MYNFAANLSMMFTEVDFIKRFAAARDCGFTAVELLLPYQYPAGQLAEQLAEHRLAMALFNAPAGNWDQGERGLAIYPHRVNEFRHSLQVAFEYCQILKPTCLHIMAGIKYDDGQDEQLYQTYCDNLCFAGQLFRRQDVALVIEPINEHDVPGYFLRSVDQAAAIINELRQRDIDNIGLQFDVYHCQRQSGDVSRRLKQYYHYCRHFQIAGVPERHEPDQGELYYPQIFALLQQLNYQGYIGCEYRPQEDTAAGLGWYQQWLQAAADVG